MSSTNSSTNSSTIPESDKELLNSIPNGVIVPEKIRKNNDNLVRNKINNVIYTTKIGSFGSCIHPILAPKKGSKCHYWAVIRNYKNKPLILLRKQIGYKASQDGEAHEVCFVDQNKVVQNPENASKCDYICESVKSFELIAKLIPISETALENLDNIKYQPWKEIFIMTLTRTWVNTGASPHFGMYYGHLICPYADQRMFKNVNIVRRFKNNIKMMEIRKDIIDIGKNLDELSLGNKIYQKIKPNFDQLNNNFENLYKPGYGKGVATILMERGTIDLSKYIDTLTSISHEEVITIAFQILQALTCMHEMANVVHMDLHLYNLLIKDLPKPPKNKKWYRTYGMYDKYYHVPLLNYDVWIIDFGRSEKIDLLKADDLAIKARDEHNFLFNPNKTSEFYGNVKYNLERGISFFREYFKSFDVLRVFTELHIALRDRAEHESLTFLSSMIHDAKTDFLGNLSNTKLRKGDPKTHYYVGHPKNLLEKYFYRQKIFSEKIHEDEPDKWIHDSVEQDGYYGINKQAVRESRKYLNEKLAKNKKDAVGRYKKAMKGVKMDINKQA